MPLTLYRLLATACFVAILSLIAPSSGQAQPYEASWESLDQRPTPEWYRDAKFGIFIHWGVYSVPAWAADRQYSEWYWQRMHNRQEDNVWWQYHKKMYGENFPYAAFAPMFKAELFDPDHWADVFKQAGAKYVVLTSKHHDGFCLWPNELASRHWGRPWHAGAVGPRRDLLGDLTQAVRDQDIRMGYYFSFYEWFNPLWLSARQAYVDQHMIPQLKELVTTYRPDIVWCDGEWDMSDKEWKSEKIVAWLFNESPVAEYVAINDRWGRDCRHRHGGFYTTEYGAGLADSDQAWEECRGMAHSFGYSRAEPLEQYKSAHEMLMILIDLTSRGGNLLLDIGPDADGTIPLIMEQRLLEMGDWLDVNGEAIHGTRPWTRDCQWSDGEKPEQEYGEYKVQYDVMNMIGSEPIDGRAVKQAFFTRKGDVVYAIVPYWPGRRMVLKDMGLPETTRVTLLGVEGDLDWTAEGADMVIETPTLEIDEAPCRYAYTFRLSPTGE